MELSETLLKDFSRGVKKASNRNNGSESIFYGVALVEDNNIYVVLDGTEIRTPVVSTVEVKTGDRVMVMLKNHSAIITGNITDPVSSNVTAHAMSAVGEKEPELNDVLLAFSGDAKYAISFNDLKNLIEGSPDYDNLINKPSIEGVTLSGNKTFEDLTLESLSNLELEALLI